MAIYKAKKVYVDAWKLCDLKSGDIEYMFTSGKVYRYSDASFVEMDDGAKVHLIENMQSPQNAFMSHYVVFQYGNYYIMPKEVFLSRFEKV